MKHSGFVSKIWILIVFMAAAASVSAAVDLVGDDTDLFTTNPAIKSEIPNVLIVLDNTSNWSNNAAAWQTDATCNAKGITGNRQGDAELCAIYKALSKVQGVATIGLMMIQDQNKGGYIRFANQLISTTSVEALRQVLAGINVGSPSEKAAQNTNYENVLNDIFRYFNGFPVRSGAAPDNQGGYVDPAGYANAGKTVFFPPDKGGGTCGNNYVIFIGNTTPKSGYSSTELQAAWTLLNDPDAYLNTDTINNTGLNGDVWTRFMFKNGVQLVDGTGAKGYRPIVTYAIDVCQDPATGAGQVCDKTLTDRDGTTALSSMSKGNGGGDYFRATSLQQIELAFDFIFKQIQAVNSVFAAITLPVSVSVRGTNANQVYIGVFRPDEKRRPRWPGNMKMYNLGCSQYATAAANSACSDTNAQLELKDQGGLTAVNPLTSFINTNVSSFWTISSRPSGVVGTGYWSFRGPTYEDTDIGKDDDKPDGDLVEKGGGAEMLRVTYPLPDSALAQTRKLYTCTGSCVGGDPTVSPKVGTILGSGNDTNFIVDNSYIDSKALGTLQFKAVSSLSASGTTATVVTTDPHGFTGSSPVTISGAYPTLFNTSSAGVTITVVDANTFRYTLASAPNSTNAWVQTSGHGLLAGDKVTVSGASPAGFNATSAAVTLDANDGASGTKAFFYPPSNLATAIGVASGYSVTPEYSLAVAARGASLSYSGGTGKATLVMNNHGFVTNDVVVISGVTPTQFNCPSGCSIAVLDANQFTYTPPSVPTGGAATTALATASIALAATDKVQVTGSTPAAYNTSGYVAISGVSGSDFSYPTSGTVSAAANPRGSASRQWTDTNVWSAPTGATNNPKGNQKRTITLNISSGVATTHTPLHVPAAGDTVTVTGVSCSGGLTCSGTFTLSAGSATQIQYVTAGTLNGTNTLTLNNAKVSWTGTMTQSFTLSAQNPGPSTVNATISAAYVSKAGALTAKITSLSNQATATGTIKAALAGSSDPNERENLINWVRGKDNLEDENKDANGAFADIRASVHGDVLHSRPAVINYNRSTVANSASYSGYPRTLEGGNNDVYVFYGTNDGVFHAIKGGYGTEGGKEAWGFVPKEVFGKLKRLRDNSPLISSSQPRDYFVDGPVVAFTRDGTTSKNPDQKLVAADGDYAFLYMGMRRGGRMMYALDVSDPESPRMMWSKGCPNPTGPTDCDAGYEELGQTWSEPQIGFLRQFPDFPVLIFGAGYDAKVEDVQPCLMTANTSTGVTAPLGGVVNYAIDGTCTQTGGTSTTVSRTMGRGLYIVNALTGEVVWRVGPTVLSSLAASKQKVVTDMAYAMPSDPAVLNRDRDTTRTVIGTENVSRGYLDRIYIPDTGGNVWRIDVDNATMSNWVVTKLAGLSDTALADKRKFLYRPDVVRGSDSVGPFDAVLLGSGDREHPFDTTVTNRFYMLKDRAIGLDATGQVTITEADLYDTTSTLIDASNTSELAGKKGWKMTLAATGGGEKTVSSATTREGNTYFNTFQPKTTLNLQCVSDLGTARDYIVNYLTSNPVYDRNSSGGVLTVADRAFIDKGGGYLPSPVGTIITIGGKPYSTVLSGPNTAKTPTASIGNKSRTYRYRKME